jgi:hypothetical protein
MMVKKTFFLLILLLWVLILSSCRGLPPENPSPQGLPPENLPAQDLPPENPSAQGLPGLPPEKPPAQDLPPEKPSAQGFPTENSSVQGLPPENSTAQGLPAQKPPERPEPSENIMGKGMVSNEKLTLFLRLNNPEAKPEFVQMLASTYIDEAADEGVNHDVAFAQMCLETGYLKYGGLVLPEWNNFCGLGAIGPQQPGEVFPDALTGVRAHIQHLKAYASEEPLKGELVDPRYKWVRKGSSPGIEGLSGTWAVDKSYSGKIRAILRRLYIFSFT